MDALGLRAGSLGSWELRACASVGGRRDSGVVGRSDGESGGGGARAGTGASEIAGLLASELVVASGWVLHGGARSSAMDTRG